MGEVCSLIGGGSPSRSNRTYWENGSIKWISAKHINAEGKISTDELITEEALNNSSTNIISGGSAIIVSRVSVGKVARAQEEYAINQDLTGLTVKNKDTLDQKYIFYIIKQNSGYIADNAQELGVRGVTRKFISQMKVPIPDILMQQKIVSNINDEASVVSNNKILIKTYEQKIKDKISEVRGE